MTSTINTYDGHGKDDSDDDIVKRLRAMVERSDPRGSYYIEPTWRINGVSISQHMSPDRRDTARRTRLRKFEIPTRHRTYDFKQFLQGLCRSELREIIMNLCLRSLDTHKDVVEILKCMQKKKPRPLSFGGHVNNPTVGLYLYCRTQRELVDIILEIASYDETGYFKQDVRDLAMVIKEKD
ncbi:hypothetical protein O1611_g4096 [Lasiodiplodia mahajangana]|uniref:Uncharacterized protein n=1 Tax=Lasiodiplodia mahajangana TaxID=1108764 RepID=A0ACC2JPZ1_9PEZI|nr:hypothetical protein O1611_g4096 [Lasiodiplodia mahajangana]